MSKKTDLKLQNKDKSLTVEARLFEPQENQFKNGVIVFLPDVFGYNNEQMNIFAEKLANGNKVDVVLVDTFRGNPYNNGTKVNADYSKFPGWLQTHPFEENVYVDVSIVCQHFKEQSRKICITGTCMGGNYCYQVLCKSKSLVDFGVPLYASRFDPEKSENLSFPMYSVFAEKDPVTPLENIGKLKDILSKKEKCPEFKIEVYDGVGHAFLHNPQNSEEEKQSAKAFQSVVEWIEKHF